MKRGAHVENRVVLVRPSSAPVQKLLNQRFVCTGKNTQGDPNAGTSFQHAPNDPAGPCLRGNGEHNVQMLFLTPQGEIFGSLSGYLSPEDLQVELEFALDTFEKLEQTKDQARAKELIVLEHARQLQRLGFSEEQIKAPLNRAIPFAGNFDFSQGVNGMFDHFTKGRVLADHRYAMEHPLQPLKEFRSEDMVGAATRST